uniref:Uncharacterized protein n=1 Tax=Trichogramma kaykai TaxID=54128 RepID=A0ABD2WN92_9HYME
MSHTVLIYRRSAGDANSSRFHARRRKNGKFTLIIHNRRYMHVYHELLRRGARGLYNAGCNAHDLRKLPSGGGKRKKNLGEMKVHSKRDENNHRGSPLESYILRPTCAKGIRGRTRGRFTPVRYKHILAIKKL